MKKDPGTPEKSWWSIGGQIGGQTKKGHPGTQSFQGARGFCQMVRAAGIEPAAFSFGVRHSIH